MIAQCSTSGGVCEQILGSAVDRQALGYEAVLLLTLLIQYRKYEVGFPEI